MLDACFLGCSSIGLITIMFYTINILGIPLMGTPQHPIIVSIPPTQGLTINYDTTNTVGCGSDSMGLTLQCNDKLYLHTLSPQEALTPGSIYIYNNSKHNNTVVHRLILCLDTDCNATIFKGDNNKIGEQVHRKDILYKVVQTQYY